MGVEGEDALPASAEGFQGGEGDVFAQVFGADVAGYHVPSIQGGVLECPGRHAVLVGVLAVVEDPGETTCWGGDEEG